MPYEHKNIANARRLRKEMTPWERKLWYCFLSTYDIRFQRQKSIGNYIVDFYCAGAKLAIELDGGGHYNTEAMQKDAARTEDLRRHGIEVIRFCNLDIDNNFRNVCEYIDTLVICSLPQSLSATAPSSEGAEC